MLKLLPIEFFLRLIPESFILILAGYAFSSKKLEKKVFCISAVLLAILTYFVRMLPIHFGVHTIILIMIYILLTVSINKFRVIQSVYAVLVASILLFMCEWINVYVLTSLFKFNIENMFTNSYVKMMYGMPSLLLFSFIILVFYKSSYSRKVFKDVFNREIIK